MPMVIHFEYRQNWHWVRVVRVITHFLSFIHLYLRYSPLTDRRKNFLHASLKKTVFDKQKKRINSPCNRPTMPSTRIFSAYLTRFRTEIFKINCSCIQWLICISHMRLIRNEYIHLGIVWNKRINGYSDLILYFFFSHCSYQYRPSHE
jgi:hypothetical protein